MRHTCHAIDCEKSVPPKLLMCLKHWRMVPKAIQILVWQHYVPGQETTKNPTAEYMKVQRKAVIAVARKEGTEIPSFMLDTLERLS